MSQGFGFGGVPRWEINPEYAQRVLRELLNPTYNHFEGGAYQERAPASRQQPQVQPENDYFQPQPGPHRREYAASYDADDGYYDPELVEPQNRRDRRRDNRRHNGTRGQRYRAQGPPRPRTHHPPLLNILQPVANGTDKTMDMSLRAFNALFEEQADGYVPGMVFKDISGATITGLKNQDGLRATIVINGSHS